MCAARFFDHGEYLTTLTVNFQGDEPVAYRYTDIPYMLAHDPEELKATVIRLLREFKGNVKQAAEAMGIAREHMYNGVIYKLDMLPEVQGVKDEFSKKVRGPSKQRARGGVATFAQKIAADPRAAANMLLWAYKDAKADVNETCRNLGLRRDALFRFAEQLGITEELRAYAESLRKERHGSALPHSPAG
jgi:transcriptional regulator of acetoin/glycerol metabolism